MDDFAGSVGADLQGRPWGLRFFYGWNALSLPSLKLTASLQFAPENSWLEDFFLLGARPIFGDYVSFGEITVVHD